MTPLGVESSKSHLPACQASHPPQPQLEGWSEGAWANLSRLCRPWSHLWLPGWPVSNGFLIIQILPLPFTPAWTAEPCKRPVVRGALPGAGGVGRSPPSPDSPDYNLPGFIVEEQYSSVGGLQRVGVGGGGLAERAASPSTPPGHLSPWHVLASSPATGVLYLVLTACPGGMRSVCSWGSWAGVWVSAEGALKEPPLEAGRWFDFGLHPPRPRATKEDRADVASFREAGVCQAEPACGKGHRRQAPSYSAGPRTQGFSHLNCLP